MPEKGVDLVIDAFKQVGATDARLVIVGTGHAVEVTRLKALAAADKRILFWGTEKDISSIYTLSDYTVRGEAYHCVGRTIYEALYAGCGVVIPGDASNHTLFEYDRFRERISFYSPGDREALRQTFASLVGKKVADKKGSSNVPDYVAQFDRFLRAAVGSRPLTRFG
jgi:glycosyltransferase involved in cell wall biosynthesis